MLTAENIKKLLVTREAIDKYYQQVKKYGNLLYLQKEIDSDLLLNGFDINSFLEFDLKMALHEIDRCFRIRLRGDNSKFGRCDNCGNGTRANPCYTLGCGPSHQMLIPPEILDILPYEKSEIYRDMMDRTENKDDPLNIFTAPFVHPYMVVLMQELSGFTPPACNVVFYQIETPQFNLWWQDFKTNNFWRYFV